MDYSKKRQARAKEENIDLQQMAIGELMAWGWDALDAMLVVGILKEDDSKLIAQHAAVNYTAVEDFSKFVKKRQLQLKNGAILDDYQRLHPTPGSSGANRGRPRQDGNKRPYWQGDAPEPVADEELLAAMWETICKLPVGDPKRVDLLDKYDKLKRRQGVGEDNTTIHFYLPRPECDTCPFRGGHIITDPESVEDKKPDAPTYTEEELDAYEENPVGPPPPGFSKNGKRLGRPPKRKYKKRAKKAEPTTE